MPRMPTSWSVMAMAAHWLSTIPSSLQAQASYAYP